MKITVDKLLTEDKAQFGRGDFFLTDTGAVRQIVQLPCGDYGILNIKTGSVLDSSEKRITAQIAAENYVTNFGPIRKLQFPELHVKQTTEILKGSMF